MGIGDTDKITSNFTNLPDEHKVKLYEMLRRQYLSIAAIVYELATGEKPPDLKKRQANPRKPFLERARGD